MRSRIVLAFLALTLCSSAASAVVRYVKFDATGANNGTSWANAYTTLLLARLAAQPGDEIWVARGTYRPTTPGVPNPRTVTHVVPAGVSMLGGFAGTETARFQRNPRVNVTILSGDINGDDTPNFGNRSDNSFHVVTGSSGGGKLDGFTIRGGHADGTGSNAFGGGLIIGNSVVSNCIFRDNFASRGAAVAAGADFPTLVQCLFIENRGNSVGVIDVQGFGNLRLIGCTIANNHTNFPGGGAVMFLNTPNGGQVAGCILWGNTNLGGSVQSAQIRFSNAGPLSVNLCDVEGGTVGLGADCFTANPLFMSPLGVDGIPGTGDEDFRIGAGSPCIDRLAAGNMLPDGFDVDGDSNTSEVIPVDLNWDNRNYDDPLTPNAVSVTFDLGAYEFQGINCPGDMNNDLVVNTLDLTLFLAVFGTTTALSGPGDFNADGLVNTADLVVFLANFGGSCV